MKTKFAAKVLSITAGMASCNDLKFGSKNRNQAFNGHRVLFVWRSSKLRVRLKRAMNQSNSPTATP